jgi:hypothetical protein
VCRSCGAIDDVDCAVGTAPCLTAQDDRGFTIDEAEVIYSRRKVARSRGGLSSPDRVQDREVADVSKGLVAEVCLITYSGGTCVAAKTVTAAPGDLFAVEPRA